MYGRRRDMARARKSEDTAQRAEDGRAGDVRRERPGEDEKQKNGETKSGRDEVE